MNRIIAGLLLMMFALPLHLQAQEIHTVEAGDTLYRIARLYDLTVAELRALNDLYDDTIHAGQQLIVRPTPRVEVRVIDRTRRRSEARRTTNLDRRGDIERTRQTVRPDLPRTRGPVRIYPAAFEGRVMANGDGYDPAKRTVSHPTLPLGARLEIRNLETGQTAEAVVTDRGPLNAALLLDVSRALADALDLVRGTEVEIRLIED